MGVSFDGLEKERIKFGNWRENLPAELADLKDKTAIEAIGELKKRGHIRSITVVNAPPRTVSTIVSKCLAESPSLNMKGLPVFHEVLDDSGKIAYYPDASNPYHNEIRGKKELGLMDKEHQHFLGSNVFMGKLLDSGIAQTKGADVVLKIMSHEFTGADLTALMPHVDNVVSTVRQPAQHIRCVQDKVMHEKAYDYESVYSPQEDMVRPMREYWKGFTDNVNIVDDWASKHPKQGMRHVVISGDKFLHEPEQTLRHVCNELNKGRSKGDKGYLEYGDNMLQELKKPVYYSYVDGWGKSEIAATRFQPDRKRKIIPDSRSKVDDDLRPLCDELDAEFGRVMMRHPQVSLQREDKIWAAEAMERQLDKTNLSSETRAHLMAQVDAQLRSSDRWAETVIHKRADDQNKDRTPG